MIEKNEIVIDMDLPPIPTPVVKAIRTGNTLVLARKISAVDNSDEEKAADTLRIDLRDICKIVEARRLDVSRDRYKTPQEVFKAAVDKKLKPFRDEEDRLWNLIKNYRSKVTAEVERKRLEAAEEARKLDEKRQKIQEAHAAKGHKVTELAPTEPEEVKDQLAESRVKVRNVWVYDRENIDMSKLPEEYKMPNYSKLTRDIQGKDGIHEIPGVHIELGVSR